MPTTIAPIPMYIHYALFFAIKCFTQFFPLPRFLLLHLSFSLLHFLPSPLPSLSYSLIPLQSKLKGLQQQVKTLLEKAKVPFDDKVCWSMTVILCSFISSLFPILLILHGVLNHRGVGQSLIGYRSPNRICSQRRREGHHPLHHCPTQMRTACARQEIPSVLMPGLHLSGSS